ncbi:MAG TPA: hypothetical protein VIM62_12710 [Acidobacteriaceae bacterium]
MAIISIGAERMAQLEAFAHRRGQDTVSALDTALAEYLAWEEGEFDDAVEAINESYRQMQSGETQPAAEVFEELRLKHGLPR